MAIVVSRLAQNARLIPVREQGTRAALVRHTAHDFDKRRLFDLTCVR